MRHAATTPRHTLLPVKRPAPPWLRPVTEYGPLAVFVVAYVLGDLMVATSALIAATAVALAVSYAIARHIPALPLITAIVVGIFGGLTLWLQDETFIKLKPTIVQLLFAAVLIGGLAFGRPFLKQVMGAALHMDDDGWRNLTVRFAVFFVVMAGINEVVWRTQSTDVWVGFKTFGIVGLTLVFGLCQVGLIRRHQLPEPIKSESGGP
jgi:intracellular septation protein